MESSFVVVMPQPLHGVAAYCGRQVALVVLQDVVDGWVFHDYTIHLQ